MFEYKFVEVPINSTFPSKGKIDHSTEEIRKIINEHATKGWRLVQVYTPLSYKGSTGSNYEVILEREIEKADL